MHLHDLIIGDGNSLIPHRRLVVTHLVTSYLDFGNIASNRASTGEKFVVFMPVLFANTTDKTQQLNIPKDIIRHTTSRSDHIMPAAAAYVKLGWLTAFVAFKTQSSLRQAPNHAHRQTH